MICDPSADEPLESADRRPDDRDGETQRHIDQVDRDRARDRARRRLVDFLQIEVLGFAEGLRRGESLLRRRGRTAQEKRKQ
jgi:hypothetical protein